MAYQGRCLCGDIQFRVTGPIDHTSACHCSLCRAWSGHYWASATLAQDDLVIEHGEQSIAWYPEPDDGPERGFCLLCGSSLFWRRTEDTKNVSVSLGAFENTDGLSLGEHIYTANKGCYYEINDNVPQHDGDGNA